MTQVLRGLPENTDPNLLVGSATADDAGVYQLNEELALVQTLDFFTPITDDPYLYGQIAAANSLSDVYAMGGKPITAMAIAGMPSGKLSLEVIQQIFAGGADLVQKAGCSLVGGHTIKNPEPIYGLSVTGLVDPQSYTANAHAKVGDILILTKPLGTGIISTAAKQGKCEEEVEQESISSMITLNTPGSELASKKLIHACTDVTGFGLLGHLIEVCLGSKVSAEINSSAIPAISNAIKYIQQGYVPGGTRKNLANYVPQIDSSVVAEEMLLLLADAQTSGGLLFSVAPENKTQVLDVLNQHDVIVASEIGTIIPQAEKTITVK